MSKAYLSSLALLSLAAILGATVYGITVNNLSDNEAIGIASSLSEKLDIKLRRRLLVRPKRLAEFVFYGVDKIPVMYSDDDSKLFATISRKDREVINLTNHEAMDRVVNRLGNRSRRTWPPFLGGRSSELFMEEDKAKIILFDLAKKIGLPNDVDYPNILLFKDYGVWTATWKRMHKGQYFEKDRVSISIIALNGEFYSYTKSYEAEICPTEVKIGRPEAIQQAYNYFRDYFPKESWEKNKDKFVLISADLKIIKPDAFWWRMVPFYTPKSRLAWTVVFDVKEGHELDTFGLNKDRSIIKVDAVTNKIITGEINFVF